MKFAGPILTVIACFCISIGAQSVATNGGLYRTINSQTPGVPGNSQVSSFRVGTATWTAVYDTFDNFSDTMPTFTRGGENGEFTWVYNASPSVRGYLSWATGAFLNHTFASENNVPQSTRLEYTIRAHSLPKIRPNQTVLIIPVTFTVTGQIGVFASHEPGAPPSFFDTVTGQGTGQITYARRGAQYYPKVYRQSPQAQLYLSSISLTIAPPQ